MRKIKFTDITNQVPSVFHPTPGKNSIPAWLNNLKPYIGGTFEINDQGFGNSTAKRCIPIFDAVSSGYIIKLTHDIYVSAGEGGLPAYQWPRNGIGVEFHNLKQVPTHSAAQRGHPIPKILNPWAIETPSGYSTLFVPVLNGDNSPVNIFSGVVDTDKYFSPVNFPFVLKEGFTGTIAAGTPIAQVIPIRREPWTMSIEQGSNPEIERNNSSIGSLFRNGYRKMYWSRKDYS